MIGLVRTGGAAALVGGGMRVAAAFIPYTAGSPGLETFYALIDACLLIGLIGIYARLSERVGRMGLTGFLVAVIGQGSIIGPDAVQFGIDFYLAGSIMLLAGIALLAAAMVMANVMLASAWLWILATTVAAASPVAGQAAVLVAGALLGAGFAAAGGVTLKMPDTDARSP